MTKKDYELIAGEFKKAITSTNYPEAEDALHHLACNLSDALAEADSHFKADQFIKDCGVTD